MSGQALTPEPGVTDEAVLGYRDEMDSQYRPVFDRLHRLITRCALTPTWCCPTGCRPTGSGAAALTSGFGSMGCRCMYRLTGTVASRRDPESAAGKGTIKLRPADAAASPTRNSRI